MSKYYVMQMLSEGFSPILKFSTTDPVIAFATRDDLAKQYPDKTFTVLTEAARSASSMIRYSVCVIAFGNLFSEVYATSNKTVAQIVCKDLEERFTDDKFVIRESPVTEDPQS